MGIIETFLILAAAALVLAVVARGAGTDKLAADAGLRGGLLKKGGKVTIGG